MRPEIPCAPRLSLLKASCHLAATWLRNASEVIVQGASEHVIVMMIIWVVIYDGIIILINPPRGVTSGQVVPIPVPVRSNPAPQRMEERVGYHKLMADGLALSPPRPALPCVL
jgi:hypothetical protein